MNVGRHIGIGLLGVLLVSAYLVSNHQLTAQRQSLRSEVVRAETLLIPLPLLKIISGEFKGLWADYILLQASNFLGGRKKTTSEDWKTVSLMFEQSLALDPYFFQTCYYTQGFLAWRKGMTENAIELLRIPHDYRYWDGEPGFYIGFDLFYLLKRDQEAAEILTEVSTRAEAPRIAGRLAARLALKSGRAETSIAILEAMYERSTDDEYKAYLTPRIEAHRGVFTIEKALEVYETQFGKGNYPATLKELVDRGILNEIPVNPYSESYLYDPLTGQVHFDKLG